MEETLDLESENLSSKSHSIFMSLMTLGGYLDLIDSVSLSAKWG